MLRKIIYYINPMTLFGKTEENMGTNLRFMHAINRISIFMFLLCLVVLFIRYVI